MEDGWQLPDKTAAGGTFLWLTAFYLVYCARPQDWVPGLGLIPLAKIAAALAFVSLLLSWGRTPRRFKDLPREATYLLLLIALLFVSALLSPIWRGGAFSSTLDFAKVYVAWVLTFLLITTMARLRRIIFVQAASVAMISLAALLKGHSVPRLSGVIGGTYSNPNDLAFAIVLSLPFCLAFFVSAKGLATRIAWACAMLIMATALVLTASRAGFINLMITGTVCLWHFGVQGRRLYLIVGAMSIAGVLLLVAGDKLERRFSAITADANTSQLELKASGSFEERKLLMVRALDAIAEYPILGVGVQNFVVYSGLWKEVHACYLQIAAEGGIPVLLLYLAFFSRGFRNLRQLRREPVDAEGQLFVGALHSSMVGFVVGACFAPEAYQYFPYFTVCYTSVLVAMVKERQTSHARTVRFATSGPREFAGVGEGRSSALHPAQ